MSIGVGIIGYGKQGAAHAHHMRSQEGYELVAISDMTPASRQQAEADHPDAAVYDEVDALLADERVDMVIIVTPTTSHAPLSIKAMEAGKHVVCEKPMCMNYAEAVQIRDASVRTDRYFSVFQNRRGDDYFTKAKAAIEAGHIGELRDFKIVRNFYGVGAMVWGSERFRPTWRAERAYGGGMLFDWGGHWIDQALLLHGGRVRSVYAQLFIGSLVPNQDADDGFRVLLQFEDGACAHIEFQAGTPGRFDSGGWILSGTKGGYTPGRLHRIQEDGNVEELPWEVEPPPFAFWERLREAIENRDPACLPVPVKESLRVMRIIDAAFESHDTGQAVVFGSAV